MIEDLAAAEREVARLGGLLNNLLTLAKQGQESPEPSPVSLTAAAGAARDRWLADARSRRQRLSLSGPDETEVLASHEDVGIVLDNLLENAIKYSPPGGIVTIEWGTADRSPIRMGLRVRGGLSTTGPDSLPGRRSASWTDSSAGGAGAGPAGDRPRLGDRRRPRARWRGSVELRNRGSGGLRAEVMLPLATKAARTAPGRLAKPSARTWGSPYLGTANVISA